MSEKPKKFCEMLEEGLKDEQAGREYYKQLEQVFESEVSTQSPIDRFALERIVDSHGDEIKHYARLRGLLKDYCQL